MKPEKKQRLMDCATEIQVVLKKYSAYLSEGGDQFENEWLMLCIGDDTLYLADLSHDNIDLYSGDDGYDVVVDGELIPKKCTSVVIPLEEVMQRFTGKNGIDCDMSSMPEKG